MKLGSKNNELLVLEENQKDFDELHNSCIQELKPAGLLEEEVVLDIAKCIWRKRRIERLFVDEANWLREHPDLKSLQWVSTVNNQIRKEMPWRYVLKFLAYLPKDLHEILDQNFPPPEEDFDEEWVGRVKKYLSKLHLLMFDVMLEKREASDFVGETASKICELTAKQIVLEERFNMMIDKALKRLANLKAFKEIIAVQEAGRPRKISAG